MIFFDRVWETTGTTGTGQLTLLGAKTGYQSFAAVGNGLTCFYCISDTTNGAWEVGVGTYNVAGPFLARTTVMKSSNNNAAVNLQPGTKDVILTLPAFVANNSPACVQTQGLTISAPGGGNQVTAGFTQAVLQDSTLTASNFGSGNVTLDVTVSGAGGLDTGTVAASTWYFVWLIGSLSGALNSGVLSLSSALPTMPAGYLFKGLVGACLTDASKKVVAFQQIANKVWVPPTNVFTNQAAATANTYQSQSVSTIVPTTAIVLCGNAGCSLNASGNELTLAGDSSGTGAQVSIANAANAGTLFDNFYWGTPFRVPLITDQTFFWKSLDNTSARNRVDVTGWEYGGLLG